MEKSQSPEVDECEPRDLKTAATLSQNLWAEQRSYRVCAVVESS